METIKTLEERALELLDAVETNLEQPVDDGDRSPQLTMAHNVMARHIEELREVINKLPSVVADPEELGRVKEALGRIVAWSRHHHEESAPALQNTLKLIHEEAATALGI